MNLWPVGRLRREPAIRACEDVLAADQPRVAGEPFGDQVGVLDDVARVRDDAWNQGPVVRQPDRLPDVVLVLVTGVCALERKYSW